MYIRVIYKEWDGYVVGGDVVESSSMNWSNSSSMSDDSGGDDDMFGLVIECVCSLCSL